MKPPRFPFLALLPDRLIINLCTLGPIGRIGKAPGTNGSLAGLALYTVIFFQLPLAAEILLIAALAFLAIIICDEGERRMHQRDPGSMILDELVAIPLCFVGLKSAMAATGHVWAYMLAGFALFRLFDILKPLGINRLQRLPGGYGVVADDLAAALATNLLLQLAARFLPAL